MNKSCIFKILFYICFALFLFMFLWIFNVNHENLGIEVNYITVILGIFNIILSLVFIFMSLKKKVENINLLFPVSYLIFVIVVFILMFVMNGRLIVPYIHISYYGTLIMFNYLLLNIYSFLSCLNGKHN